MSGETLIERMAEALWTSEAIIYAWGPQERHAFTWKEAVERDVVGVKIFRQFATAALEAHSQWLTDNGLVIVPRGLADQMNETGMWADIDAAMIDATPTNTGKGE